MFDEQDKGEKGFKFFMQSNSTMGIIVTMIVIIISCSNTKGESIISKLPCKFTLFVAGKITLWYYFMTCNKIPMLTVTLFIFFLILSDMTFVHNVFN